MSMRLSPGGRVLLCVFSLVRCFIVYLSLVLHNIFRTPVARYGLFVLKVPLNTNQSMVGATKNTS